MIIGTVSANREAIVQLVVLGEKQQSQAIKAVIDTGYTGFLTLPSAIITTLDLPWYMQIEVSHYFHPQATQADNLWKTTAVFGGDGSRTDPAEGV